MPSQYLENHGKELEALATHYEKFHTEPRLLYRAKCIRALIKQEALKTE